MSTTTLDHPTETIKVNGVPVHSREQLKDELLGAVGAAFRRRDAEADDGHTAGDRFESGEGKDVPPSRTLITGGDPGEEYPVPWLSADFADAPDLDAIGSSLIAGLDEFSDLRDAMEAEGFAIRYFWRKKASKQADRVKAGTLGKNGGLLKHVAGSPYTVQIAADAAYGRTRWQIEALVYHELLHVRIEMVLKGPKGAKEEVPQLKTRAHDLEMFFEEWERYGPWRFDLEKAEQVFAARQTELPL